MIRWTLIFLVIANIAALLGFTGIAAGTAVIAIYIFIVLFLISLVGGISEDYNNQPG
jgi:uncharacterized membrane protein YtjA (UPF0391 family)